ncbi:nucleoside-diphosphate sugar epimerase [Salinisphaera orenii YIM 95161]|uniref:Nucleoside-diphosphate sugar epimerase n=1 Tax=Salinisphaera orenii YIM 95161 TaxID=1051139 RepID=A0A423Q1Y7_9GAMM|nr:nucleoside-diphosphate sugar epimerase [Salinisphaera halophila YIM 95161]
MIALPRPAKRLLVGLMDSGGAFAAAGIAIFSQNASLRSVVDPWWQVPLMVLLAEAFVLRAGLYKSVIRYIAIPTAYRIAKVAFMVVAVLLALRLLVDVPAFHAGVVINFGLLLAFVLGAGRLAARHFLGVTSDRDAERLAIFGAGDAGAQLAYSLSSDRRRRVICFVDDRHGTAGMMIADVPVYQADDLPGLIESQRISSVLLAVPSASRRRKKDIIDWLEPFPVTVKTVPALGEILSGKSRISDIRDIEIEDLLGRDAVAPDDALLSATIRGRSVMVTGAGGSIGSELCRQIVQLAPEHLVLFEVNELSLFNLEREIRSHLDPERPTRVTAILGSVLDASLVATVIRRFRIQTLYHAAAYKHVPLVEQNVAAGLCNNVLGTRNVAEAAVGGGVTRFILVSTDKAVRPTNVMGATKRASELVVQAMAARVASSEGCIFSMVRFGNVLGSSGSVVPYFREQINKGGPITVTHPDITRFFMTIPEAAQLVIQAGAMAQGSEVFLLDMGEPVRIRDLAKRMIHLAGFTHRDERNPNGDIEIVYSGLRPGEKLYEELLISEASATTQHSMIGCAQESYLPWEELLPWLEQVEVAVTSQRRGQVKQLLQRVVSEYTPATDDHDAIGDAQEVGSSVPDHPLRHGAVSFQ